MRAVVTSAPGTSRHFGAVRNLVEIGASRPSAKAAPIKLDLSVRG